MTNFLKITFLNQMLLKNSKSFGLPVFLFPLVSSAKADTGSRNTGLQGL
jgi:hypothetical protein